MNVTYCVSLRYGTHSYTREYVTIIHSVMHNYWCSEWVRWLPRLRVNDTLIHVSKSQSFIVWVIIMYIVNESDDWRECVSTTHCYVTTGVRASTNARVCMSDIVHLYVYVLMCDTTLWCVWHDHVPSLILVCDMTHSYVWHDSFTRGTWLIHICDTTHSHVGHDSSHVGHDSIMCRTRLIHMCGMAHSYVWHGPFMCVAWLIHMCDMAHSYVLHGSYIYVT